MIALGSDHAGFEYKERVKILLKELHIEWKDFGTHSKESVDYPDYAHAVAEAVSDGQCETGILVCGTGIGVSIVANKHKGIRAAACESYSAALLARKHNNANILCFGGRITGWSTVEDMIKVFLDTNFEGGRHTRRVEKIHSLTSC